MRYFTIGLMTLIGLLTLGCAYPSTVKQKAPLPQTQPIDHSIQESAQKLKIEKELVGWENKVDEMLNFIQIELGKINEIMKEKELSVDEYNFLAERKKLLGAYRSNLIRIKNLQQKLPMGENTFSREDLYLDLINNYLSTLKLIEALPKETYFSKAREKSLEDKITQSYQANNYYQVIECYQQLTSYQPEEKINFTTKCYYGLSLIRLNQVEEARKVVEKIFASPLSLDSENAPLCFLIGEWMIDQGQVEAAQKIFQQLNNFYQVQAEWQDKVRRKLIFFQLGTEDIKIKNKLEQARFLFEEKNNFLAAYRLAREAKSECYEVNCQQGVQNFLAQLEFDTLKQIDEKIQVIDEKIKQSDYTAAKTLLLSLKNSFPPGEYPPSIQDKLALLTQREEQLKKIKIITTDPERQKLDKAIRLIAAERFEEAINLLGELEESNYQLEVNEQKLLAINGLARSRRLKAGQLFLQAKNCSNPELKKSYLLESYRLLKETLDKYPNNIYADKIMKNLMDVRSEIEKYYPELLSSEKNSGSK